MSEKHLGELTVDDWGLIAAINLRAPLFLAISRACTRELGCHTRGGHRLASRGLAQSARRHRRFGRVSASDNAAFLTGEVIILDGGRTARSPMPQ